MNNLVKSSKRSCWNRFDLPFDKIIALYKSGISEQGLAKRFGVNRGTIRRRLIETGTEIRRQKEANFLRSSNYSAEERKRMARKAHEIRRGMKVSWETKCRHAQTIEKQPYKSGTVSKAEKQLRKLLINRGIQTIPQKAFGAYNCDLAAYPVAVEIFGGAFHWYGNHGRLFAKRTNYILNSGWFLYIIFVNRRHIDNIDADKTAAFIESIRRNKPTITEYRVIGRAGKLLASGCSEGNHLTFIPTACCPSYIANCLHNCISR